LASYFERQECLSEIPDIRALLSSVVSQPDGAGATLYLHTPLNRLANDALARVAVRRLKRAGAECRRTPGSPTWALP